ncbi:AAA family ATPase [Empedobacter falsenii]
MGVVIKKIQLKNWFGYKGEYEENSFDFSDGVNVIVATNDVGKSKLHNAFRWIIDDKVILKNIETSRHEIVSINLNNIEQVLNHFVANTLTNGNNLSLGVKLTYEVTNLRGDSKIRILTKEIVCKKEVDHIKFSEPTFKVEKIERGNVRTATENFNDCLKELMRNNLKHYFLVQGENVENLTALKGDKLAETINLLVELDALDKKHKTSENLYKSLKKLKDDIQSKDNRDNDKAKKDIDRKQKLENEIVDIEDNSLIEIEGFIIENEKIIQQYAAQAEEAKERIALKKEVDQFNNSINFREGTLKTQYKKFVDDCINGDFWISKLNNNESEKRTLDKFSFEIRAFVADRRAELDDRLSKKEQKMLAALERDQPRPVILEQMVEEGQCYVCSQDLKDESKIYIKEKLIPYFKKELNHDDNELRNLEEVHDLFKKCQGYLNKYASLDLDYISKQKSDIIKTEKEIRQIEEKRSEFLDLNGSVEESDDDKVNLLTYSNALIEIQKLNKDKKQLQDELIQKKSELSQIQINSGTTKVSKEYLQAEKLYEFSELVNSYLSKLKNEEYTTFCSKLEEVANMKWKAFTKSNKGLNSQNIKVDFSINSKKDPDFEIKVVDMYGNNAHQGGGASQAIRQLSVIFGLIEIAGGNVNYPFIADAPTSNATLALTEEFFNYQLNNAKNQNILITKELWDDRSNELNSAGIAILNSVRKNKNARFVTITNGDHQNKTITKID